MYDDKFGAAKNSLLFSFHLFLYINLNIVSLFQIIWDFTDREVPRAPHQLATHIVLERPCSKNYDKQTAQNEKKKSCI